MTDLPRPFVLSAAAAAEGRPVAPALSPSAKFAAALLALAAVGVGAALWLEFGGAVFFDLLAAGLIGCFF